MKNIIDIDTIRHIDSADGLLNAVAECYNDDVEAPQSYVLTARMRIKERAKELGFENEVNELFNGYDRSIKTSFNSRELLKELVVGKYGPLTCTENFLTIMSKDPAYSNVRYNLLTRRAETLDDNGKVRAWSDYDDAASRGYIEKEYCIHNVSKHEDAFKCLLQARSYHPIKDIVEQVEWDGESRIEAFLHKYTMCEDTPYTREVSRLIFAGGIHRLYDPGCKFDDMPVLIGKQGAGKSTIVRWLAIDDAFFREVNEFEGQKGMEILDGAWICEVSEMLAMTKVREQAAVKSYLTRLVDSYRPAYGKHIVDRPRACVFIGTSNHAQFISDKTGGRRFYPVECNLTGYELHNMEAECKEYIKQCWAEALAKIDTPFMKAYADQSLKPEIETHQENAAEEDYRVGLIEDYLSKCKEDKVCTLMLWERALGVDLDHKKPDKADQTQIGLIMNKMNGWKRNASKWSFGSSYGRQKYWERVKNNGFLEMDADDDNPFPR